MTQNTKEIISALQTVASFIGEDVDTFKSEMLNRKFDNDCGAFTDLMGDRNPSEGVTLRTQDARTDFDVRLTQILHNANGHFLAASDVTTRYCNRYNATPTGSQMRASLNRLIENGEATWEGNKRGTKYAAVMN